MSHKEPFLGILQVPTTFHRPPGDVGNLDTWSIPVKIRVVEEAKDDVVRESKNFSDAFVESWIQAALELVDEGAVALITSCGFLATIHERIQSRISVPVGTSSVIQIPLANKLIGDKKLGILTFDEEFFGKEHLRSVGVDEDIPIVGVKPGGVFQQVLRDGLEFDHKGIESEVLEAATRLIEEHPETGGFILECTNIPPYKRALFEEFHLPIWDIITLGNYLYQVGLPQSY